MKARTVVMLLLAVGGSGCATTDYNALADPARRNLAVGYTGCTAEEMNVIPLALGAGVNQWAVQCGGRTYLCSATGSHTSSCHERSAQLPPIAGDHVAVTSAHQ